MMYILMCYDIVDDKRRKKVEEIILSYGNRVNYSVFELIITKSKLEKIKKSIYEIIDTKSDSIRVYQISKNFVKKSFEMGDKIQPFEQEAIYV